MGSHQLKMYFFLIQYSVWQTWFKLSGTPSLIFLLFYPIEPSEKGLIVFMIILSQVILDSMTIISLSHAPQSQILECINLDGCIWTIMLWRKPHCNMHSPIYICNFMITNYPSSRGDTDNSPLFQFQTRERQWALEDNKSCFLQYLITSRLMIMVKNNQWSTNFVYGRISITL